MKPRFGGMKQMLFENTIVDILCIKNRFLDFSIGEEVVEPFL